VKQKKFSKKNEELNILLFSTHLLFSHNGLLQKSEGFLFCLSFKKCGGDSTQTFFFTFVMPNED
jgi:hypothetical protein